MIPDSLLSSIKNGMPGYIAHWLYLEHGKPTMIVARYNKYTAKGKSEKEFRQWHKSDGEWQQGVFQGSLPLYGLHSLHYESPFGALLIFEGEACASLPHQLNWPSITSCLGGSAVNRSEFSAVKIFKRFIICPDNDHTGIEFARKITAKILEQVPDAEIYVCYLTPELPGGDLIDWVKTYSLPGHNWDGFSNLSDHQIECLKASLYSEINQKKVLLTECSITKYSHDHALFEGSPEPIEDKLLPVPPFPLETMPKPIQDYVRLWAQQVDLPPDFIATAFLGLASGVIGRSVKLQPQKHGDWLIYANLFGALVGAPSAKKSPALSRAYQLFLSPLNERARSEFESALLAYKERKRESKAKGEEFDEPEPKRRRFDTSDFSLAALKELLSTNPRGIIIRSDELASVLKKLDNKGNESDRSILLSCWSGNEIHYEDRITRKSNLDIYLTASWIGTIQPGVMRPYLAQALSDGVGNDGFIQRFQLITYPDIPETYNGKLVEIPEELKEHIAELALALDRYCLISSILTFDEEAQAEFDKWHHLNENRARQETKEYWQAHLGKIPKLVGALCIQLHLLNNLERQHVPEKIDIITLSKALTLTDYFIAHAQRLYNSLETIVLADARKIYHMIKSGQLSPRFKSCDIYRNQSGTLKEPERVNRALELLREHNIIAQESYKPTTGRPGREWVSHPELRR